MIEIIRVYMFSASPAKPPAEPQSGDLTVDKADPHMVRLRGGPCGKSKRKQRQKAPQGPFGSRDWAYRTTNTLLIYVLTTYAQPESAGTEPRQDPRRAQLHHRPLAFACSSAI